MSVKILTQEEVSEIFKVSKVKFRHWVKSGSPMVPPFFNIGTDAKPILRFMEDDVENHILRLSSESKRGFAQIINNQVNIPDDDIPIVDIE
jgi:hypothetical protein